MVSAAPGVLHVVDVYVMLRIHKPHVRQPARWVPPCSSEVQKAKHAPALIALKGEPLARQTAFQTDETILSWHTPCRFLSSLVFATVVATPLYQLWKTPDLVGLGAEVGWGS